MMSKLGTEKIIFNCSRTNLSPYINLYFEELSSENKKYISLDCIYKYRCGVYTNSRINVIGHYDWALCPAYTIFGLKELH
jgi:hypothetical protein